MGAARGFWNLKARRAIGVGIPKHEAQVARKPEGIDGTGQGRRIETIRNDRAAISLPRPVMTPFRQSASTCLSAASILKPPGNDCAAVANTARE